MVHTAAYAKMKSRLGTLACTATIGPGAATATINRLPVLQQLESNASRDISVGWI